MLQLGHFRPIPRFNRIADITFRPLRANKRHPYLFDHLVRALLEEQRYGDS
jgi:hypothetical protein